MAGDTTTAVGEGTKEPKVLEINTRYGRNKDKLEFYLTATEIFFKYSDIYCNSLFHVLN